MLLWSKIARDFLGGKLSVCTVYIMQTLLFYSCSINIIIIYIEYSTPDIIIIVCACLSIP